MSLHIHGCKLSSCLAAFSRNGSCTEEDLVYIVVREARLGVALNLVREAQSTLTRFMSNRITTG